MRLRVLNEAECYARCYGAHEDAVQVIELVPRSARYEARLSGEEIRRLFELRLDAREPVDAAEAA
ncbi:MAG: hypothetical protein M3310_03670 [Actinomycetota bacterium]|nr:hypothetical protein [Actinomycetota bacterium]